MWRFVLICILLVKTGEVQSEIMYSPHLPGHVCVNIERVTKTRYESYMETYRKSWGLFYQTKWRTNWKIVSYPVYEREKICCPGYVEKDGICEPTCNPPCDIRDSVCTEIDRCECFAGYALSSGETRKSSTDEEKCQPICPKGCGTGHCTAPSECTCEHGYIFINDTCKPYCSTDCGDNAYCASPDTCECQDGYNWTSHESELKRICRPVCEIPCSNGVCSAPNTCTCNYGYVQHDYDPYQCLPFCELGCRFGTCIAPNLCSCNSGFTMLDHTTSFCVPVCRNVCVNGVCIAPETCSCNEGFAFKDDTLTECEPICEKTCGNGTCISPGECVCHEGYHKSQNEDAFHVCEPYCKTPCGPYGTCTAPNTCTCPDGFRLVDPAVNHNRSIYFADNSVCEPVCSKKCENGYCNAPEVCICNPGYRKVNDNCEPICNQACVAGYCSAPNKCTCNDGYKQVSSGSNICTPVCNQNCVNGFCTRPDTCTCNVGYEPVSKDSNDTCKPTCKKCGPNTVCTAPEICTCKEGYAKVESSECRPICKSCANGTCIDPDVCKCDEGFFLWLDKESNSSSCRPLCLNYSHTENWEAAENCVCQDGYVKKKENASSICVKLCEDDCNMHGTCNENKTCQCFNGWRGDRCDQSIFCRIYIDSTNRSISNTSETNKNFLEALNDAELCPFGCTRKIINITECTVLLEANATENTIACLIEKGIECQARSGISTSDGIAKTAGIATGSTLIIILIVAAVYLMIRKRRNGRLSLGTISNTSTQRRPTLLPEDENDDQDEDL